MFKIWRVVRAVYGGSLESCCGVRATEGSNPSLSSRKRMSISSVVERSADNGDVIGSNPISTTKENVCSNGGIGRHARLRI